MAEKILSLANDTALRERMGAEARRHICTLASSDVSVTRLEKFLQAAVEGRDNPFAAEDLRRARETAAYLDEHQFGHSFSEQIALRPFYYRVRFHEFRHIFWKRWR